MRRLTDTDIRQHFLPEVKGAESGRFSGSHPNLANTPKSIPRDKVQESRVFLWQSLQKIGQAMHENRDGSPVVTVHLKEADEAVRQALRLIL